MTSVIFRRIPGPPGLASPCRLEAFNSSSGVMSESLEPEVLAGAGSAHRVRAPCH